MFNKYDAYKDSGFQWIGEIPTNWFNDRLGTILEPVSKKGNADKPLLSITREKGVILRDVEDDSENHNFIPDDLSNYKLIEKGQFGMNKMKAWQGSYGVSSHTGIVSPAYYVFKFIKPIYPEFFHWAIRSKTYISFFGSASEGVRIGQWDLSKDRMKNIPFVFPDLDSQKKIVEFIQDKAKQIDQAIAIKEQQIALLNERKQIVIQKAVTQGLNPNVAIKDSGIDELGDIPNNWSVKKLKEICNTYGRIGFRGYGTKDIVGEKEGAITLSPSNINEEGMVFDKLTYLSWAKYYESPEIMISIEDILIVKTGSSFGKVGYINALPEKSTINPQLLKISNILINPKYFYYVLVSDYIQVLIKKNVIGSTIPTISEDKILNMKVCIPDVSEQKDIVKYIDERIFEVNNSIEIIKEQIRKLKEYKTTLINDAVTGKIKVA